MLIAGLYLARTLDTHTMLQRPTSPTHIAQVWVLTHAGTSSSHVFGATHMRYLGAQHCRLWNMETEDKFLNYRFHRSVAMSIECPRFHFLDIRYIFVFGTWAKVIFGVSHFAYHRFRILVVFIVESFKDWQVASLIATMYFNLWSLAMSIS